MRRRDLHSHVIRVLVHVSVVIAKIFRHRYPLHVRGWDIRRHVPYIRRRYTRHLHLHRLRHEGRDGRDMVVALNWELLIELRALPVLRLTVAVPRLRTRWRSSPRRRRTRRRAVLPVRTSSPTRVVPSAITSTIPISALLAATLPFPISFSDSFVISLVFPLVFLILLLFASRLVGYLFKLIEKTAVIGKHIHGRLFIVFSVDTNNGLYFRHVQAIDINITNAQIIT